MAGTILRVGRVTLLNCAGLTGLGLPGCQLIPIGYSGLGDCGSWNRWLCFGCLHSPASYPQSISLWQRQDGIKHALMSKAVLNFCCVTPVNIPIENNKQITWLSQSQGTEQTTPFPGGDSSAKVHTWQRSECKNGWRIEIIFCNLLCFSFPMSDFNLYETEWYTLSY